MISRRKQTRGSAQQRPRTVSTLKNSVRVPGLHSCAASGTNTVSGVRALGTGLTLRSALSFFFDEGNVRINTSTWPQCGRAVANLLALKVLPDDESDKSPTLASFKNKSCYVSSFNISQKQMFESVLRVTGTKEGDWKITHESAKERFRKGQEEMKKGDMVGWVKVLYTRYFFPDQSGSYEDRGLLDNEVLGLLKEDLDEYTREAVKLAEAGGPQKY